MALDSTHLQAYLERHAIEGQILHLDVPTPTVESAAQAVSAEPDQIVKTLVFLVHGEPVAAIACGTARVDRRPIAARFGVGRKRVRLATPAQVLETTGYPAGAVPPFGHAQTLPTLLDPRVLEHRQVYAGGGEEDALLRLDPTTILQQTEAQLVDLLEAPDKRA